jgi:hypothetical protein
LRPVTELAGRTIVPCKIEAIDRTSASLPGGRSEKISAQREKWIESSTLEISLSIRNRSPTRSHQPQHTNPGNRSSFLL